MSLAACQEFEGGVHGADKSAAVEDDMPRLAWPDLADAIKRWQDVWEYRDEPGTSFVIPNTSYAAI